MKFIFPFLFVTLYSLNSFAQLKANAGNDIYLCWDHDLTADTVKLGSCPVASGGIEPYTYEWSGIANSLLESSYWRFASEILNDTTSRNPFLKEYPPADGIYIYLKVQDAKNNIAFDSVWIELADYTISTVGARLQEIRKGDSVQFYGNPFYQADFLPLSFEITPTVGLTDPTNIYGWAKPETSIGYYLQATNKLGCKLPKLPYMYVMVDTLNVGAKQVPHNERICLIKNGFLLLPAHYSDYPYNLSIFDLNGRRIISEKIWSEKIDLSKLIPHNGKTFIINVGKNKHYENLKVIFD